MRRVMRAANSLALYLCIASFAVLAPNGFAQEQKTIRNIYIDNQNVFNPKVEKESGWAYRLANALHITSKQRTVRKYLLFKVGDVFVERKLAESERLLRSKRSFQDADIYAVTDGEVVDIYVTTKDTWSLKPKLNASHSGGVSKSELGIQEDNLFGLGVRASVSFKDDSERQSTVLKLIDDNAFDDFYYTGLTLIDSTDGSEEGLSFYKPFYAYDTPYSYGATAWHRSREESIFEDGEEVYRYISDTTAQNLWWGFSKPVFKNSMLRTQFGVYSGYEDFSPLEVERGFADLDASLLPINQKMTYPYVKWDFLQDSYLKANNYYKIGVTEDIYTGLQAGIKIGYGDKQWHNNESRWYLNGYFSKTLYQPGTLVNLYANFDGRLSAGEVQEGTLGYGISWLQHENKYFKFYAAFDGARLLNPDKSTQLSLDSESGFRGYPLHSASGETRQKLTLEQRYYSKMYVARIFHVGAAAFYDIGTIDGTLGNTTSFQDVGIGLRLGNSRTSEGDVIHIDFAYPIDASEEERGWKFSVESKKEF